MKLLRALYYQYYWWQMRREKDESSVPLLAVLCLLIPIFGIVGFIAIVVDVTGLITLQKYDMKLFIFAIFVLGFKFGINSVLRTFFTTWLSYNVILIGDYCVYQSVNRRRFRIISYYLDLYY